MKAAAEAVQVVQGFEDMMLLVDRYQQLGQTVLLCAAMSETQTELTGNLLDGVGTADYYGTDTSEDRRLVAFDSRVPRAAVLFAMACTTKERTGTGPHVEYNADGHPTADLMSKYSKKVLRGLGLVGRIMIVKAEGWEPDDAQVATNEGLGPPLLYRLPPKNADSIEILGIADVPFGDIEAHVRQVDDPSREYPQRPASPVRT